VLESGAITVRSGKDRKDRTTYLDGGAAAALADWLAVRGSSAGPLLCPVNKGGVITIRRLSDQAVLGALQKRARQATVPAFSPHNLRRTFISDLLDAGADIATVQRMAGHASPETTSRYDRHGEATKRRAASLLHLAYTPHGRCVTTRAASIQARMSRIYTTTPPPSLDLTPVL